jgi:2-oxoglutarate ferredoxin oxidoreductase subunit alpha
MSARMVELGRVFLQAESELAAVNMLYGAGCAGARAMTSSSSPGISLMQEGFSYIAGSEVPAVVVNVMRGGPGLGNIQPSQGDYYQITRSAGHGDFHPIVLAPATVQEGIDLMALSFELAEQFRTLVILALDGAIGQMMEPAELPPLQPLPAKRPEWALTGAAGRKRNIITSIYLNAAEMEAHNRRLQAKLVEIKAREVRYQTFQADDAQLILVAFGTAARVAQTAVDRLRREGLPVGLFRPITLWPFPEEEIGRLAQRAAAFLVVEMNAGQMFHDVREAVYGRAPVHFYGRMGGVIPMPGEVEQAARTILAELEVAR